MYHQYISNCIIADINQALIKSRRIFKNYNISKHVIIRINGINAQYTTCECTSIITIRFV